jgi:hypothetical protein
MPVKTIQPTQEQLLAIALAKKSPAWLGNWLYPDSYKVPKHIDYLADLIIPMLEKGGARIIVCAPPRHGKSELINIKLVIWFLWKWRNRRIILAGHTSSFATTFGERVRDEINEHYNKLGITIKGGVDAAMDDWGTKEGGGMRCAGVGVAIVGLGADLFIIDDPTPDSKNAASPTHNNDLRAWYTGVVDRRLQPGASVIVSMQRWPGNDFVSWLTSMRDQGREDWVMINLAALYDMEEAALGPDPLGRDPMANGGLGSPLWEEVWPIEAILKKRKNSEDISFWYSQYQQRPPDKSMEGIAYRSFSSQNCTREAELDPNSPILLGCDFNVDPMCWVVCQSRSGKDVRITDRVLGTTVSRSINKTVDVMGEIFIRNTTTQEACRKFCEWVDARLPQHYNFVVVVYGDASGWRRKTTAPTDYKVIKEELQARWGKRVDVQLKARSSNPRQKDRVIKVNNGFFNAEGMTSLFVSMECTELRSDFISMKWKRSGTGEALPDLDDSNPLRGHMSDALGYLVDRELGMKSKIGEMQQRIL